MREKKRNNPGSVFETFNSISKLIYFVSIVAVVIAVAFIVIKMNKMNWSFFNTEKRITVDIQEYFDGLESWDQQDYKQAELKLKAALDMAEKAGINSLDAAVIRSQLGRLYLDVGKYDDSYEMLMSAYIVFRDKLGENDGNTIIAKCNLSVYDIKTDHVDRGFSSLNDAYDEVSYVGYKVEICRMLARCYTEMGNYKRANEFYKFLPRLYNLAGYTTQIEIEYNLEYGDFLLALGEHEDALSYYYGALSCWEAMDCFEDITLSTIYFDIAKALADIGKVEEGKTYGAEALAIRMRLLGEDSVLVAYAYNTLASILGKVGDSEEQLLALENAKKTAIATVGDNHAVTASIYSNLGDYYYKQQKTEDAIINHNKALEIRKNILGIHHIDTVTIFVSLIYDYLGINDYENAAMYAEEAVRICGEVFGKDSPNNVGAYNVLSRVYAAIGRMEEAQKYIDLSLDICGRYFHKQNITFAEALETAGTIKYLAKNYDESLDFFDKALNAYQLNNNLNEIGHIHLYMSDVYIAKSAYEDAMLELNIAWDMLINFYAEDVLLNTDFNDRLWCIHSGLGVDTDFATWISEWKAE